MYYLVELDYKKFLFDNIEEASIFAQCAKKHKVGERELEVTIKIIDNKEDI
jgi:hypothetical protein